MNSKHFLAYLLVSTILMACAGAPSVSDQQLSTAYGNVSPAEAFKQAEQSFKKANDEKLAIFSPQQFKNAKSALEDARKIFSKSPQNRDLLKYTYVFDQHLKKAYVIRTYVKENISDILVAKKTLIELHVKNSYSKEYSAFVDDIKTLISDIELNQSGKKIDKNEVADNSRNRDKILKEMLALEVDVVKFNTLNKSKKKLQQSQDDGLNKLAVKTFSEANKALANANAFISRNVKDVAGIKTVGKAFTFAVDHAVLVAHSVEKLKKVKKNHYESYILQNENNLLKVSKALESGDYRDKPMDEQVKLMIEKASAVSQSNRQNISSASEFDKSLAQVTEKLKAEKRHSEGEKAEFEQRVIALKSENKRLQNQNVSLKGKMEKMLVEMAASKQQVESVETAKVITDKAVAAGEKENVMAAHEKEIRPVISSSEQSLSKQILSQALPVDLKKALESEAKTPSVGVIVETAVNEVDSKE